MAGPPQHRVAHPATSQRLNPERNSGSPDSGTPALIERNIQLVGAVLAEQHDEWAEGRRYLGLDLITRCRIATEPVTDTTMRRCPA